MFDTLKKKVREWLEIKDPTPADEIQASGLTKAQEQAMLPHSELHDNYLFDFRNWQADRVWQIDGGGTNFTTAGVFTNAGEVVVQGPVEDLPPVAQAEDGQILLREIRRVPGPPTQGPTGKIKMKPVDVVHELEHEPSLFDLNNLDDKIAMLKDKEALIKQHYAKREVTGLIERLENRKRYPEFKAFFDQYKNTTDQKIEALLTKYQLVMKTSDIFIPEFPDEAIKAMKAYTDVLELICAKKPVFYVIAEEDKFRKAYEKRDPILLVQSPFGFFWQILGAWDKEMLILSEL